MSSQRPRTRCFGPQNPPEDRAVSPTGLNTGTKSHPAPGSCLLLLAAFALLVGGRLGLPLLEPEESLYAVVPRDMMTDGRFVVPVLRGEPYLDKPPLLYWAVMGS